MDRENRRLVQRLEIVGDPNVFECIIVLYSFSISKEKIDQVISVVLSKLIMKVLVYFFVDLL